MPTPISRQNAERTKNIGWDVEGVDSTLTRSLYYLKEEVLAFSGAALGASTYLDSQAQLVQPVPSLQPHFELYPQQPFFSCFSVYGWTVPLALWTPSYLLSLSWINFSFFSLILIILASFLFLIFYLSSMMSCFILSTYLGSTSKISGFSSIIYPSICHSWALVIFMMTSLLSYCIFTRANLRGMGWWPLCNFWYVPPNRSLLCGSQPHWSILAPNDRPCSHVCQKIWTILLTCWTCFWLFETWVVWDWWLGCQVEGKTD